MNRRDFFRPLEKALGAVSERPSAAAEAALLRASRRAMATVFEVLLPCGGDSPHCELNEDNSPLGYYLIPDRAKLANVVAELFYDPLVRQEGARVEVRGTRNGAAQDVADRLAARAFGVATVTSSAAVTARSEILVRNGSKRYTADQLSKQLSGIPVRDASSTDQTDADIVVVVGADFKGLATDLQR